MSGSIVHPGGEPSAGAARGTTASRPVYVQEALRGLTRVQKSYVIDGAIHGDPAPVTIRALLNRALFYIKIDSPNGRCGPMVLTPLGETVRAILLSDGALGRQDAAVDDATRSEAKRRDEP